LYKKVPSIRFNRKNNKKIRESPIFIDLRRSIFKKSIIFVIID
jgi:hypothetical protein